MSRTFRLTQSNKAQSKGRENRAQMQSKAGNKFSFMGKKLKTGKIATAIIKNS